MGNFKQNKKFGKFGAGDRGNDRGGGGFDRNQGRSIMHEAVCSACGKNCEVPFRPTGDKPVYCNDCFRTKRGEAPRRPMGGGGGFNRFSRPEVAIQSNQASQSSGQFEMINQKLDRILKMLSPVMPAVIDEPKKAPLKKAKAIPVKKIKAKPKKKK